MIELTCGFSKSYKQICSWKDSTIFKDSGTVTAREIPPYVKSHPPHVIFPQTDVGEYIHVKFLDCLGEDSITTIINSFLRIHRGKLSKTQ